MIVTRVGTSGFIRSYSQMRPVTAERLMSSSRNSEPTIASSDPDSLKSDVKNLYKNLIYLSREWPTDLRPKIKQAFMKNKDVQDPHEIRTLIGRGEYVCREITATYHLRKYRAMKRRYYDEHREKEMDEMFKDFSS